MSATAYQDDISETARLANAAGKQKSVDGRIQPAERAYARSVHLTADQNGYLSRLGQRNERPGRQRVLGDDCLQVSADLAKGSSGRLDGFVTGNNDAAVAIHGDHVGIVVMSAADDRQLIPRPEEVLILHVADLLDVDGRSDPENIVSELLQRLPGSLRVKQFQRGWRHLRCGRWRGRSDRLCRWRNRRLHHDRRGWRRNA